ncbi:MAG: hypothetical protein ACRED4_05885, partial [Brevundimonas sp.]
SMTEAISCLEKLGSDPALGLRESAAYEDALDALGVDCRKQRRALLDRDVQTLVVLLEGRATMVMAIATPDNGDEPQQAPERHGDEPAEPEESPGERDRPD